MTPQVILDKLEQLNEIVSKYPDAIPLSVAAGFLGMDGRSLRSYLQSNPFAFGMSWLKSGAENRAFKIPSVKFYLWYRNGII